MSNPPGSFIWYELMTPDPDTATSFYRDGRRMDHRQRRSPTRRTARITA